jgi:PAS domain S-box-containing protein
MVVDNDPTICTFMKMFLEKKEMEVRTAEDGLQALSVLEDYSPDLMFIDLVMPNISGDKLGLILRSQRRFENTYLVVLSAISSEQEIDYVSYGFDACVAKGPMKKLGDVIDLVVSKLGTEITRISPGGVYGLENLYKREITRELLSTKRHFELILQNMAESIIELTPGGKIVFVNAAATRLFGVPEEDLLSCDFFSLFDENQRTIVTDQVDAAIAEAPPEQFLVDHQGKKVALQVLTVDDEGIVSAVVIAENVTEKYEAEEALRHARDELEMRVEERTVELARANESLRVENDRRVELEDRLRASLREKEVMLDEIHHRVKNNLQVISSLLGLNANRVQEPEFREIVEDMRRRVQSLSLIHDRLYRSHDLAAVQAGDYFQDLVDGLVGSFAHNDTQISVAIEADEVNLPIDVAVPCALITNELITNSLKHAFADRSNGSIRLAMQRQNDGSIVLEIEDDGRGLLESVDLSEPDTLGLRIVKVLARQLGARLRVRRNGGTMFRIEIPAPNSGVTS